jgi:hypothetical protein
MKRPSWDILPALIIPLLLGLGLGLVYSWMISPARVFNSEPVALRADFKDQYRLAIAAAYAATGNLPRAQARLSYLGDSDPVEALSAQAQRMLANGQPFQQTDQVAALALALENNGLAGSTSTSTTKIVNNIVTTPSSTLPPPPPDIPIQLTETLQPAGTEPAVAVSTLRPTRTLIPTPGSPFTLTGQEALCDPNLPDGLLQVIVYNSNHRQLAGVEIIVTWDGGKEQFFTGFKPEISNGYADFIMTPNITYTVQLATGSDVANGLTTPTCQSANGEAFFGGIKLTFQR